MKSPNLEGWDEENVSYYCRVLCNQLERWAGMVRVEDVLRYYADLHGMVYNITLLITPKESLSAQHVGEMELSGIYNRNR